MKTNRPKSETSKRNFQSSSSKLKNCPPISHKNKETTRNYQLKSEPTSSPSCKPKTWSSSSSTNSIRLMNSTSASGQRSFSSKRTRRPCYKESTTSKTKDPIGHSKKRTMRTILTLIPQAGRPRNSPIFTALNCKTSSVPLTRDSCSKSSPSCGSSKTFWIENHKRDNRQSKTMQRL